MPCVIDFESIELAGRDEPENPINPIRGYSLGVWMHSELTAAGFNLGKVQPEDWGWYCELRSDAGQYLLGFIEYDDSISFVVQIHKERSLKDKLLGRAKMTESDELVRIVQQVISKSPICAEMHIEFSA